MTNKRIVFWILQTIGWGGVSIMNAWGKSVLKPDLKPIYIYSEAVLFFTAGIIASLIVRKILKQKLHFDAFQAKEIKSILLALLIGTLVLFFLLMLSIPLYSLTHDVIHELGIIAYVSTLLNSFLYILFWILIYVTIKLTKRFRQNKLEQLELESSLKESQLNTLKGQINPHFMFNSLNNIRGLMLEDVDKSREMITRLSDMLRYSLTKNDVAKTALKDELEMVDNYIELSKIQLEDRLQYQSEIDKSLLNIKIPPMLIQMLIENAIKHGISNQQKGGIVTLNILKKDENLLITVRNTGKLVSKKGSTKIGLENIKKRLVLIYRNQADFSLKEVEDEVISTIKIPL